MTNLLCVGGHPHDFQGFDGKAWGVCIRCGQTIASADPDPSPYEQGFRDGLLSARASLEPIIDQERGLDGEAEWTVLKCARELEKLIDQKNHDLWNLLAIARADLSRHPEAEGLRAMLRAPSGLLVNSSGQVLFIRIKGTEYDTGVLALLEEVERLKAAEEEHAAWKRSVLSASG